MSLTAIRSHIASRLGCLPGELPLATEELVFPYEENGMALSLNSESDAQVFTSVFSKELEDGSALEVLNIREKLHDYFLSLAKGRPSYSLAQRCGMDREDTLAVDLQGNVLTCQNTAASEGHTIGTTAKLDDVGLVTSWHWIARQECRECPVIQLCRGGCMRLSNADWEASCRHNKLVNYPILRTAINFLTKCN